MTKMHQRLALAGMFVLVAIFPMVYSYKELAPIVPQILLLVMILLGAALSNVMNRADSPAPPQISKTNQALLPIMFSATMMALIFISYVHETGWIIYAMAGLFWMIGLYAIHKRFVSADIKKKP